ncbi:MAG: ABC transporter ATP-binding protein [Lachnospiraceae bacterium]|nr:ABC transporter ATP-binding protein [Lachnospiraceae bacterium]
MSTIVEVKDLVKYYGKGDNLVKAVDHTDFKAERGTFTAVVGRSGSGKSTLLQLMGGLDRPDSGKVIIDGTSIYDLNGNDLAVFRRRKIGFIFQDYNLIPSLDVWENLVLPLGLDGRKANEEEIEKILEEIGLSDRRNAMPDTLSGGQKQRVAIGRALASNPSVILADEPTGNLDSRTELEVLAVLKRCVADFNSTIVMITHNEAIAQMADVVTVIEDGKVVR